METTKFIDKHWPENKIPLPIKEQWAELIELYSKEQLLIHLVSQQRELLKFFSAQLSENLDIDVGMNYITEEDIEECLKNFNCG